MAKGIYVGVAGVARKVINVWTMKGGVLKQKCLVKGGIAGVIKDFITYYIAKVWEYTLPITGYCICVDSSGNIYTGDEAKYVTKISVAGEKQWEYLCSGYVMDIKAVGSYIYVGDYSGKVTKLNSSGGKVWEHICSNIIWKIAVDSSGYIYAGQDDGVVTKITTAGAESWEYVVASATAIESLTTDASNNVYIGDNADNVVSITSTKAARWSKYISSRAENMIYAYSALFVMTTSGILKLSTTDGTDSWSGNTLGFNFDFVMKGNNNNLFCYSSGSIINVDTVNIAKLWSAKISVSTLLGIAISPDFAYLYTVEYQGKVTKHQFI